MCSSQEIKQSLPDIHSACENTAKLGADVLLSTAATGRDLIERELREINTEMPAISEDVARLERQFEGSVNAAEDLHQRAAAMSRWLTTMQERVTALTKFDMTVTPEDLETSCKVRDHSTYACLF